MAASRNAENHLERDAGHRFTETPISGALVAYALPN